MLYFYKVVSVVLFVIWKGNNSMCTRRRKFYFYMSVRKLNWVKLS